MSILLSILVGQHLQRQFLALDHHTLRVGLEFRENILLLVHLILVHETRVAEPFPVGFDKGWFSGLFLEFRFWFGFSILHIKSFDC